MKRACAFALLFQALLGSGVMAQCDPNETFELLASDGAQGSRFGFSVAIEGTVALIGAIVDHQIAQGAGAAYLFDLTTGAQLAKLLAFDGAEDDLFGGSVGIAGSIAVVGAERDDNENGADAGAAYLLDISDPTKPVPIAKLIADDGSSGDTFGVSVAISDTTVIAGAPWDDDHGVNSGSAYLFDAETGEQLFKLVAADGAPGDKFGLSVGIAGTTAIVGGFANIDGGLLGAAYLFDTETGEQVAKLLPDDGAAEGFGSGVAIGGGLALIGAYYDDDNGEYSGAAYLFDVSDPADPVQVAKLHADDGAAGYEFGTGVAMAGPPGGQVALIGAIYDANDHGNNAGAVYLFDLSDPTRPVQVAKLVPDEIGTGEQIGHAVAADAGRALIGSDRHDGFMGAAYAYDLDCNCAGDVNGDGALNILDFVAFQLLWAAQDAGADCNADGAFDVLDFVCFQQLFVLGCD